MADEKLKFDRWQVVEDALKKSSAEGDHSKSTRILTALITQAWSPPALHMAKELEKLRKAGAVKSPIFIIDADDEKNKTAELGFTTTPVLLFWIAGQPLTFRRPDCADEERFTGSVSKENIVELFQAARTAENEGSRVITIDF